MVEGKQHTEGEQIGIKVTEEDVVEVREHGENSLVGKLWAEKKINKGAFKSILARI